jgi:hypothetical protein
MRKQLIEATRLHLTSHINKHVVNLEVMLNNPITIPEHTDIMESIEKELGYISEYRDKLESLENYFGERDV